MMLRIIQFLTFLLAAYFFGTAIQQNWLSPWMYDLTGPAFAEVVKNHMQYTNLLMPALITVFELLIVLLLILQAREWRKLSYILLCIAFISIAGVSLLNTQMSMRFGKEIFSWGTGALPANWVFLRNEWLNYQFFSGLFMTGVSLLIFISIFISWFPLQRNENSFKTEPFADMQPTSATVVMEPGLG